VKTKKQHVVFAISNRSGKTKSVVVSEKDLWSIFERLFQREGIQLASCDRVYLTEDVGDLLGIRAFEGLSHAQLERACGETCAVLNGDVEPTKGSVSSDTPLLKAAVAESTRESGQTDGSSYGSLSPIKKGVFGLFRR
jgi:hypothetical protein